MHRVACLNCHRDCFLDETIELVFMICSFVNNALVSTFTSEKAAQSDGNVLLRGADGDKSG